MLDDIIEFKLKPSRDSRGAFTNIFNFEYLKDKGIDLSGTTISHASNILSGKVRGLHYQAFPFEQAKVVWCSSGSSFDVVVDINPDSIDFGKWRAFEFDSAKPSALFIPAGFAHGYQTRCDDTVISYLLFGKTSFEHSQRISWKDRTLGIHWPLEVSEISKADEEADVWPPKL